MDPTRLLVLRAVRRTGGVLPAARALHLTPSGISQHLAKLEAEAGVALVDRSRRGGGRTLRLTAAGRALAEQAEQLAAALASAEREVDRYRQPSGGTVRVGGFASVLNRLVARTVVSLSLTEPEIDPRIFEIDEAVGLRQLARGQLDLLLSERPVADEPPRGPGVRETDLMTDPFRIVVPDSWPDVGDNELLAGPWVLPHNRVASRRALERVATARGISIDARHIGRESATMLALVSAGLGAAIIPQLTLANHPRGSHTLYTGSLDPGQRTLTVLRAGDTDTVAVERFLAELDRQARLEEQDAPTGVAGSLGASRGFGPP
ncbi:LysR family transcriptional regulator [Nocardioides lentus]